MFSLVSGPVLLKINQINTDIDIPVGYLFDFKFFFQICSVNDYICIVKYFQVFLHINYLMFSKFLC